jgi:hypothetical protein
VAGEAAAFGVRDAVDLTGLACRGNVEATVRRGMSDSTSAQPPLTLVSASSRLRVRPTATTDDEVALTRLATWLAEVSAETALHPPRQWTEPRTPGSKAS